VLSVLLLLTSVLSVLLLLTSVLSVLLRLTASDYPFGIFKLLFMLFIFISVKHDFHIRWCLCRLIITRRVSSVEQKMLSIPDPLSPPPQFLVGVRVARSLVFWVVFCSFFLFIFAILLSVLRFAASDYSCDISKLFLQ